MAKNTGRSGSKKGNPKQSSAEREAEAARRSAARTKAREIAEAQARKEKRLAVAFRSAIAIVIVAVLVGAGILIWRSAQPGISPTTVVEGGVTVVKDNQVVASPLADDELIPAGLEKPTGDQLQEGAPHVEVMLDFQCPVCQQFEMINGEFLETMVDDGRISLEYQPVSILDAASGGNRYATRAANAAMCVADSQPEKFTDVVLALFNQQPGEGESGRSDEELVEVLTSAEVDTDAPIATAEGDEEPVSVATCIADETFSKSIEDNTKRQADLGHTGTPTILVNGEPVDSTVWQDPRSFAQTIIAASEAEAAQTAEDESADAEGAEEEPTEAPAEDAEQDQ